MSDKQEWIGLSLLGAGIGFAAMFGALAAATSMLGPVAVPIWGVAAVMMMVLVRSPIAKAFAERLGGRSEAAAEIASGEVYAELDDLRHRLAELEERQDFTERLLARSSEPGRLPDAAGSRE